MSVFIVIRHTRADEEAGRLELIGSARVGRQAPLASAIGVAALANVVITAVLCVVLPLLGLPAAGSVALSLAIGTCGLAFTGIAAVTAQLPSGARAARGLAFGVLGVAFLARAVGDSAGAGGPAWLTWVLPLGWTETLRPFAGERWWVLALPLALFAAGARARRSRSPRTATTERACCPTGPAGRSRRDCCAARSRWPGGCSGGRWRAGRPGTRFSSRSAARRRKGIGQLVGSSGALEKEFTRLGGQAAIVNAYLASLMLLAGLGRRRLRRCPPCSGCAPRRRQAAPTRCSPARSAGSAGGSATCVVAVAGTALLLAVAGLATGLGYGLRAGGTGGETARMLGAGLAATAGGAGDRGSGDRWLRPAAGGSAAVSWTAVGLAVALNIFGQVLQLSHWVLDISPFTHVPRLPGGTVSAAPLLWLSVIAVALGATGLAALRRRDIGSAGPDFLTRGRLERYVETRTGARRR